MARKIYGTDLPKPIRLLEARARVCKKDSLLFLLLGPVNYQWHPKGTKRIAYIDTTVVPNNEVRCLTKKQYEVLKIVCDTYQKSISEYMQEALIEVMRTDIEEGSFCEALLDKLGGENQEEEKRDDTSPAAFFNNDSSNLQF